MSDPYEFSDSGLKFPSEMGGGITPRDDCVTYPDCKASCKDCTTQNCRSYCTHASCHSCCRDGGG